MKGRSLAYLAGISVEQVKGIGEQRARALAKAGIVSVADLLQHFPRRYIDRSNVLPIGQAKAGEQVTLLGEVRKITLRRIRGRRAMVEALVYDKTGMVKVVWFNQPFREGQFPVGSEVALAGQVKRFRGVLQMTQPECTRVDRPGESLQVGRVVPIHPTAGGVGPRSLLVPIDNALRRSRPIIEVLPEELVERLGLAARDLALADIHFPESLEDAARARDRLVFDELFRISVALAMRKHRLIAEEQGIAHAIDGPLVAAFIGALPFELTGAQRRVIAEISKDLAEPHPMHRLLQGEVGSGKTVVAMAALLTAVEGGYQGAVMAPTEVLADQHYLSLSDLVATAALEPPLRGEGADLGMDSLFGEGAGPERPIAMALLTANSSEVNFRPRGSTKRADLLAWIASGHIDVVVGTHALIQEGVEFADLGLAVVDEQHRFGVHQRVELREKGRSAQPDMLIMTATPIPRTLSMTLYGDLDVSGLDEMPPGRLPVETFHASKSPQDLARVYERVRKEAAVGRQTFVVCPLVEDSDKIYAKSATAEHARLQEVFPDLRVGLIHGQLRPADKEAVMASFRAGELDVLVATTVIEVGIDVPDATVMVIEDADRFGLSQLHQLRGRVGRGQHASVCFLVAEPTTPDGERRIAAMVETNDGFRLAEEDLLIRGQGTVFGARQAGLGDLKLADILADFETLKTARDEAFALVATDPRLAEHPELATEIRALLGEDVEWLFLS